MKAINTDGAKLHEECGIIGIYGSENEELVPQIYYGLFALQHRGQESCGIAVNSDGIISCHKDAGLVNDVFTKEAVRSLGNGEMALGHVRYAYSAASPRLNAQPVCVNHSYGCMALANNGSIINSYELREQLEKEGSIFQSFTNAELISHLVVKERLRSPSIETAVSAVMDRLKGSYSLLIMSPTKLIAVRDPAGIHPLCMGKTAAGGTVFASESCALDSIGAKFERDVEPGEIIIVDKDGIRSDKTHCGGKTAICVFEYIYFARPDSRVDGCSVHTARQRLGRLLAKQHPVDADIVIGVPDSGLDAAIGYSLESGIPYGIGFIKNKYIGRTFIQPTQSNREDLVHIKLNPISATVKGKRVVLVDDSIVRGTTSARIVRLLRSAGATEVHMMSSAPKFLYPCYYGTDIDSQDKLIAFKHTTEEIAEKIGVDSLGYLDTDSVKTIAPECKYNFCDACFTGEYPCGIREYHKKSKYMIRLSERNK